MLTIFKSVGVIWKLFSAFAAADFTVLSTIPAVGVEANLSMVNASSTFLPRTIFTNGRTLRGDLPVSLDIALTSIYSLRRLKQPGTYFPFLACGVLSAFEVCPLKVRVGENSPNLCPTIFSVMNIGTCLLPLCTPIVSPTIMGKIVDARAQVFITAFSPERLRFSTFFSSLALMAGPFLVDLDI